LLSSPQLSGKGAETEVNAEMKKNIPQEMNQEQVKRIIKFIDSLQDEKIKETIFNQLGYECFYARKLDEWIGQYVGNVHAFLGRINVEKKSKYWESLVFNKKRTVLKLTGKKVDGCACAFADTPQPPKSLCNYCCKNFQQQLFGMLLGKKVEVEITESLLRGDEHCSTLIHI
jgi:hypothetical protein